MNTRIDYESLAADYAAHRRIHPGVLKCIVETAELNESSRVLEVGCGTGNYISAIQTLVGCAAYGIDPSAAMLERARGHSVAVEWQIGQAESIPFPAGAFDLVFSVDVIHHVGDRSAYFREAKRVLSAGGRLCTATDSESDIARRRPLSSHFPETVPFELGRYPKIGVIRAEMAEAGLSQISERHTEIEYALDDSAAYRNRAYSALHLIDDGAFERGLKHLATDLAAGPVASLSLYTLIWGSP